METRAGERDYHAMLLYRRRKDKREIRGERRIM